MLFPHSRVITSTQLLSNRFSTVSNCQLIDAFLLFFLMRRAEFTELPKQTLEYQTMNETWPLPVCCCFYVLTDVHRRHRRLKRAFSHYYQSNGRSGCIYATSVQFYYLACACSVFALLVHATFSFLSNTHIHSFDSLIQSLVFQSQV